MDGLTSVFPPPPPYYKEFTPENRQELADLEATGEPVPERLEFLIPPEPPATPTYRGFGSVWNFQEKLVPLEEAGVKRLYGDLGSDFSQLVKELKKLLRSALVNYLALIGMMAVDPESFPPKVEDLRIVFVNMHHLLNLYRPHQSREGLILLMNEQIAKMREEIDRVHTENENIKEQINRFTQRLPNLAGGEQAEKPHAGEWDNLELSIDRR